MNKELFDRGLAIRKKVLGAEFVEKSLATADEFNMPMQELTTEYCWGAVWGREGLPHKTRSMLNLAMISVLNRPHELKMHVKGALKNGVSKDEIREVLFSCKSRSTPAFPRASMRSGSRARRSPKSRRAPDTDKLRRRSSS
jgi:4-carboxymuconolactone decarboxylase